jgi:hypothetical protein
VSTTYFERVYTDFRFGINRREGQINPKTFHNNDGYIREGGLLRKWPGCKELVDFGDTVVRHINYYESNNTKTYIAVTDNGETVTVWKFGLDGTKTSLGNVSSATGSKISSDQLRGASASVLVLGFSNTSPQQYNGTTLAALTGWPPTYSSVSVSEVNRDSGELSVIGNPWIVKAHNGRINLSGDVNNPDEIYQSGLNRADVYTPTGTSVGKATYLSVTDGDSKGGIQWLESWKSRLVAIKKGTIALIKGFHSLDVAGNNPYELETQPIEHGTNSPFSVVKTANDLRYLDEKGIYRSVLSDLANIGDLRSTDLSYDVQEYFDSIPESSYPYVVAANHAHKNYIWLGCYKGTSEKEKTNYTTALWHLDDAVLKKAATGTILFSANPTPADTITINGTVFTFVASGATGNEINIGSSLLSTLAETVTVLNASADTDVNDATYSNNGADSLIITHDTPGTGGNAFTIAASAGTASGATLTGGTNSSNLIDSSGTGLTLTNNGDAAYHIGFNLYQRGSIDFNGSTQWLSTTSASKSTAYTALTVECEIKPDALPTGGTSAYIVKEDTGAGTFALYLKESGGSDYIVFSVTDSTGTEKTASYVYSTPVTFNTWTSLAGKWDGSTIKLYLNGTEVASSACTSIQTSNTNGISIGSSAVGAATSPFNGKIDDIRFQSVAVSDYDISKFAQSVSKKQNRVLALDYGTTYNNQVVNDWDMVSNQVFPTAMLASDNYLFTGTADGKILLEYNGDTRSLSSRPARLTIEWDDLSENTPGSKIPGGSARRLKQITEIEIEYGGSTGGYLNCEVAYPNGQSGGIYTINLDEGTNTGWGSAFGVAQWGAGEGTDWKNNAPDYPVYPYGCGEKFQIVLHTWLENKPINIKKVIVKGYLLD